MKIHSRICLNENAFLGGGNMNKIDHIGIAVHSIDNIKAFYESQLGLLCLGIEKVENQGVKVAFFQCGDSKIELLEPLNNSSPVAKFLQKRGEGIHHIAFGVGSIEDRIQELKERGIKMIDHEPRLGAGGASIAFLHPSSTAGVLYELCEKKPTEEE